MASTSAPLARCASCGFSRARCPRRRSRPAATRRGRWLTARPPSPCVITVANGYASAWANSAARSSRRNESGRYMLVLGVGHSILATAWIECGPTVPYGCSVFAAGQRRSRTALTGCQVLLSLEKWVKSTYYFRLRLPHGFAHLPIPYQTRVRNHRLGRPSPAPLERPGGRARRKRVRLVPEGGGLATEPARCCGPLPRAGDGRGQGAEIHRCAGEVRSSLPRRRRAEDDDRPRVPRPLLGGARQLAQPGVRASLLGTDDEWQGVGTALHRLADRTVPLHQERQPAHASLLRARAREADQAAARQALCGGVEPLSLLHEVIEAPRLHRVAATRVGAAA